MKIVCAILAAMALGIARGEEIKDVLSRYRATYAQKLQEIESAASNAQRTAEAALETARKELPDRYLQAMDERQKECQRQGNLDGVLAARRAKDAFRTSAEIPAQAANDFPYLYEPQTNAFRALRVAMRVKSRKIASLADKYVAGLEQLAKSLTTQGRIDDAVAVNDEIAAVKNRPEITAARFVVAEATQDYESPDALPDAFSLRTPQGIRSAVGLWNSGEAGAATEAAVLRALRYLKKNQEADGSWPRNKVAMTAFSILTFLAHGETPGESREFGPAVRRAIEYLLKVQDGDGTYPGGYQHPIAAYALCEAYGMTLSPNLKVAAQKAIDFCLKEQHASGGWNYYKQSNPDRNDTSVMGWAAQALKAAKMAEVYEDKAALDKAMKLAIKGFQGNASPSGGFGYTGPGASGLTGIGTLCMQFLGAPTASEVGKALALMDGWVLDWDNPRPDGSPQYYFYYATQAKFRAGGSRWTAWNYVMRQSYVKNQKIQTKAIEDMNGKLQDIGWWENHDAHTDRPIMDTCLAALQLMVYYRYKPSNDAWAVLSSPTEDTESAPTRTIPRDLRTFNTWRHTP